jgi:hypothetical protein
MEILQSQESLGKKENERLMQILAVHAEGIRQTTTVVFKDRPVIVTVSKMEDSIEMRLDFNDDLEDVIVNFDVEGKYIEGISGRDWQEKHIRYFLREFTVMH